MASKDIRHIKYLTTKKGIYPYKESLNNFIRNFGDEDLYEAELGLSKWYWIARNKDSTPVEQDSDKIKVLVHIRNGDTAIIKTGERLISIFGSSAQLIKSYDEIKELDRRPVCFTKVLSCLDELSELYGQKNLSILLISDGYRRSAEVLIWALIKRELKLSLGEILDAFAELRRLDKVLKYGLLPYTFRHIIGENKSNLMLSIHGIAEADFVIMTSGGFAYFVHYFFRKNSHSRLIDIRNYNKKALI